ncbi:ABC transporter ATP-binding protein [Marininema halotolerans]|uniref:ATP-binding cassette, subfamily B n=1 Tax=Marininema halotolerans TaxID=1155944 RepID=A0A1I6UGV6_9BACL|nr:ABC transporter ATP-binding protein [Marininema halotolerans]SFT00716.1 ATP-binding cassette, subfamily B [Marininema halotolerans]
MPQTSERKGANSPSFRNVLESFKYWPRILKLLWQTNPLYFLLVFGLNGITSLIPAASVMLTQMLMTQVGIAQQTGILQPVLMVFALFAGLALFREISRIISDNYQAIFSERLSNSINMQLMKKADHLPYRYFEDAEAYDKLQRARQDSSFRPFQIFQQILQIIGGTITLLSVAGVLFYWQWWLALVLLLIPLTSSFSYLRVGEEEFQIDWNRAAERRKQSYFLGLMTTDASVKEVKVFGIGSLLLEKYRQMYERFFKEDKKLLLKRMRITLFFQIVGIGAVIGTQLLVVQQTVAGVLTIAMMMAYIQAIAQTQATSSSLLQTLFVMYQNNLYVSQLFAFLDIEESEESIVQRPYVSTKQAEQTGFVFQNVSFRYPGTDHYVLKNINLQLKPGETLAIVGENGSGKSTLVKLLVRLYELEEGDILYQGRSIRSYSVKAWRDLMGTVFQDFIRYELTARENIALGNWREAEHAEAVEMAAKNSGATTVLERLPLGLDTQLGKWFKEGVQLSGGQWQKIAIARAYMRDAALFVLDEPSAALDPKAEKEVFDKFAELTVDKMGIFISHRYSTVRNADRIIFMQQGEILESGTHASLMKRNGSYAVLYQMQAAAYIDNQEQQSPA